MRVFYIFLLCPLVIFFKSCTENIKTGSKIKYDKCLLKKNGDVNDEETNYSKYKVRKE